MDPVSEQKFANLMSNIDRISSRLSTGQGSVGRLLKDTTLYSSLSRSSQNLQAITDSIHSGKGALAQMISDPAFYPRIKAISVKTDSLLYKLQHGGTAAQLLNDKQLYLNLVNLSQSLDSLSTDLKNNPKKYVNVSVF